MTNLWPKEFKELELKSAKEILEEQSKFLPDLTKNMVYAEIKNMEAIESILNDHEDNDFKYTYNLKGKYLSNYSYKILSFSNNIRLYPVRITLDENIVKELALKSKNLILNNQHEFESILSKILKSNYLLETVGAIMKYTNANMKTSTQLL